MMEIIRVSKTDKGTLGQLLIDGKHQCVTCEDPDNNNQKLISCIPEGTYSCEYFNGSRFQNVWEVKNVPGRSAILIHQGNTIEDTHGCILVGRRFGTLKGMPAVLESNKALEELRKILPKQFTLTIRSI